MFSQSFFTSGVVHATENEGSRFGVDKDTDTVWREIFFVQHDGQVGENCALWIRSSITSVVGNFFEVACIWMVEWFLHTNDVGFVLTCVLVQFV